MAARSNNRMAALRNAGKSERAAQSDPVTLGHIVGMGDEVIATIASALGGTATQRDVDDLAGLVVGDVRARLTDIAKQANALAKSLGPDDIRISTKDGRKAYAYAVVKAESGAQSLGVSIGDALGEILAKFGQRK